MQHKLHIGSIELKQKQNKKKCLYEKKAINRIKPRRKRIMILKLEARITSKKGANNW